MQSWCGHRKAFWKKQQGISPGMPPSAGLGTATGGTWSLMDLPGASPFPPTFFSSPTPKSQRSTPFRASWDPRNKTFLSAEGSQAMVSGP